VAAVLGAARPLGRELVRGLVDAGVNTMPLEEAGAFRSATELEQAILGAEAAVGRVDAVVDATVPRGADAPTPLADLDAADWSARVEEPLRDALHVLQGSYRALRRRGGRIVVLLPTLGMTGAAGSAPWAAVSEGYRSMAKAAARAWGRERVTISCVGLPSDMVVGASLDRPGLPPPAFGHGPDPRTDVAPVVAGLLSDAFRAVTGLTLAVDGGVWMTP
jgi:3-oxoacyl-[acyl-carrier protein] reductase